MCSVISSYCMGARGKEGSLESRMRLPIIFETRGFFLSVTTSSQRKQPWMKQVDSTFLQIRPPSQDPYNRTCIRKQSKRSVNWWGSLEMMCFFGIPGEYSSAARVWCILGSVQWREKKKTKQTKRASPMQTSWEIKHLKGVCIVDQPWAQLWLILVLVKEITHTLKSNSFQAGFWLNGIVSSKPREVNQN